MDMLEICKGNPGAMAFVSSAYSMAQGEVAAAFHRMLINGITGDKLYMLWNDCCDRNTKKAIKVMRHCPMSSITRHLNYENGRGLPYADDEIEKHKRLQMFTTPRKFCASERVARGESIHAMEYVSDACKERLLKQIKQFIELESIFDPKTNTFVLEASLTIIAKGE